MKKAQRGIYLVLAAEIDTGLATFCKYACWTGTSYCDGGDVEMECEHPLVPYYGDCDCECVCPNTDCWGFRPELNVPDVADIVGIVLAEGYLNWAWMKVGEQILVSGRKPRNKGGN